MKIPTNIPQGYKSSPLGIIPKDWEVLEFGQIADIAGKKYTPSQTEHVPCIELEHMVAQDGGIYGYTDSANQESTKNVFEVGDVLFGKLRPYLRKFWLATFNGVCSSEIWVFKNKKCSSKYLYDLLQSDRFIQNANVSFGSKMPRADWNYLQHTLFPLPPLAEQERIAELLGTWDRAIEMQKQLIEKLELRKKGLMQQLFPANGDTTPQLRFPGFTEEWEEKKLGEVSDRITEKVGNMPLEPISVSANVGIISQKQRFGKDISGEQYKCYIHIKKGDYCYNRGNSKCFPQGCIYELRKFEAAAAPNAFISFRFRNSVIPHFFNGYFDKNAHGKQLAQYITSGARSDGLLNLNAEDFFKIKFLVPSLSEQQKIADYLSSLDYEIQKMTEKLNKYIEEKKGLMQVLLTGKKRI